jgi:hypothetical protein
MSSHREPDLEDLLRRALHEHAERITPADDGLMRIRDQIGRRRRPWSIRTSRPAAGGAGRGRLRPALTAAAVASAVAAVVALPVALHDHDGQPHRGFAASHSGPHALESAPGPTATGQRSGGERPQTRLDKATSSVAEPTPAPGSGAADSGPADLGTAPSPDEATSPTASPLAAWPYQSAAEAVKHVKSDDRLRRPELLATEFVGQFVPADLLSTGRITKGDGADLAVTVQRKDTDAVVCVVHLVPIADASPSYLVKDATAPDLTVNAPPTVTKTPAVKLDGKFAAEPAQTARIWAGVGSPDATGKITPSDNSTVAPDSSGTWAMTVAPTPLITQNGVVAVWSVDADGDVLQFAAVPVS